MFLVVSIDHSQDNAHEDVQVNYNVHQEKYCKPAAIVIGWHPRMVKQIKLHHRMVSDFGNTIWRENN